MKPDPLPPTIPFLSIPLDYRPPALPSLSRRIASSCPCLVTTFARVLLALYAALVLISGIACHRYYLRHSPTVETRRN